MSANPPREAGTSLLGQKIEIMHGPHDGAEAIIEEIAFRDGTAWFTLRICGTSTTIEIAIAPPETETDTTIRELGT